MKRALMKQTAILAGAAFAAISVGALAHADERRQARQERHEIRIERLTRIDANSDGFITRAEAQAEAERAFGELDTDNNGKLDTADRGHGGPHMFVHRRGGDAKGGRHHGRDHDRDVDVIVRTEEGGERTIIERREFRVAPKAGATPSAPAAAPRPPVPPRPPMTMMLFMNADESDLNNDGSLSKEEFVAQQLRFFDASDANRDGRIKFDPPMPPKPPEAPTPPAPPQPPRR
jgi:hypothetical protein